MPDRNPDEREQNRAQARANRELGWCVCGEVEAWECECFGTYQLSVQQGLTKPRERTEAAYA